MDDFGHVDYPHEPGTLYDCMGCEFGTCVCDAEDTDGFGCVSQDCVRDMVPYSLVDEDDYFNPEYEEYYHGT